MSTSRTSSGLDLHLDLPVGRGRRAALEAALRHAIRGGRLIEGQRLPPSRVLAADLGVARGTVVEAYAQLLAEGYLRARPGAGTEVAGAAVVDLGTAELPVPRRFQADFRFGRPDLSAFPRQEWLRALRRVLHRTPHAAFGPLDPRGSLEARTVLAHYLSRVRGVQTDPALIVVCNGFTQGLRLVCEALAARDVRSIALEDPCLPDHRATAAAAGLNVVAMEVDDGGARPAEFGAANAEAVVLTPAHQAPLGATLDAGRRAEFVRLASRQGAYVIEDDYDGEFRYDRHPIGALQGLAPERVVYAGSVSKSLAPGLRLGWLVLPAELVEPVVEAKRRADRGTDILGQLTLAEMIESGALDRHIRRMRLQYRRRRDALVATVTNCAPAMPLLGVAAGLHVTARLPESNNCEPEILAAARHRSIALTGLDPFWHHAASHPHGLIFGYGTPSAHAFPDSLSRLEQFLRSAL